MSDQPTTPKPEDDEPPKEGSDLSAADCSTWGDKFTRVIVNTQESMVKHLGSWWHVHDFELDCGLLRIDVMGKLDVLHMSDCFNGVIMDGKLYEQDDLYE